MSAAFKKKKNNKNKPTENDSCTAATIFTLPVNQENQHSQQQEPLSHLPFLCLFKIYFYFLQTTFETRLMEVCTADKRSYGRRSIGSATSYDKRVRHRKETCLTLYLWDVRRQQLASFLLIALLSDVSCTDRDSQIEEQTDIERQKKTGRGAERWVISSAVHCCSVCVSVHKCLRITLPGWLHWHHRAPDDGWVCKCWMPLSALTLNSRSTHKHTWDVMP